MISASGIAPIAICIQKPIQPSRENASARLLSLDDLRRFWSFRNIFVQPFNAPASFGLAWRGCRRQARPRRHADVLARSSRLALDGTTVPMSKIQLPDGPGRFDLYSAVSCAGIEPCRL